MILVDFLLRIISKFIKVALKLIINISTSILEFSTKDTEDNLPILEQLKTMSNCVVSVRSMGSSEPYNSKASYDNINEQLSF